MLSKDVRCRMLIRIRRQSKLEVGLSIRYGIGAMGVAWFIPDTQRSL